jgi:hypothetical protein
VVFSLPQLVKDKQYNIDVDYDSTNKKGTVTVTYVSNSNIFSKANFYSDVEVNDVSFNSQPGQYSLEYSPDAITLTTEGV